MGKRKIARIGAFALCLAASGGLIAAATGATGAYFSDAKPGTLTGTIGSIKIQGSGGSGAGLDFHFDNMLPGVPQAAVASFSNTGANAEDVWLVFPNADALHALNNLGTYGEIHILANADHKFDSNNLNDGFPCGTPGDAGPPQVPTLCALPRAVKLFSNVAPGGAGSFSFSFNYGSKLQNPAAYGASWNPYPLGHTGIGTSPAPDGYGLPYQLVATQVGIDPS